VSVCGCGGSARLGCCRRTLRLVVAVRMLVAVGLPLPAVAQRLGHASPTIMAAIYSHALKGSDYQAAEALQRALGAEPPETEDPA
jgi:hypothetical protein